MYYVDIRTGCCAIRDSHIKSDTPGLDSDTPGVIKFWNYGRQSKSCPTCGHIISDWNDGEEQIQEAKELCEKLNVETSS